MRYIKLPRKVRAAFVTARECRRRVCRRENYSSGAVADRIQRLSAIIGEPRERLMTLKGASSLEECRMSEQVGGANREDGGDRPATSKTTTRRRERRIRGSEDQLHRAYK